MSDKKCDYGCHTVFGPITRRRDDRLNIIGPNPEPARKPTDEEIKQMKDALEGLREIAKQDILEYLRGEIQRLQTEVDRLRDIIARAKAKAEESEAPFYESQQILGEVEGE